MQNLHNTMLVVKNSDGKEVGRIAATSPKAMGYINELVRHYKEGSVEQVEDKDAAMISRMISGPSR